VLAADALMDADRATIDRVIRTHWYELVDPTTPTSRLLELAGIDPSVARADAPGTLTEVTEAVACP
jgi:hypothetical protein